MFRRRLSSVLSVLLFGLLAPANGQAVRPPVRPQTPRPAPQAPKSPDWIVVPSANMPPAGAPQVVYVRQPFGLSQKPIRVSLTVASREKFRASINGIEVLAGEGIGAGKPSDVPGQTLDVLRSVRQGRNVLAFECDTDDARKAGIRFALTIRFRDGRTVLVVSNGDERTMVVAESQRIQGWNLPTYDDKAWVLSQVETTDARVVTVPAPPNKTKPSPPPTRPTPEPPLSAPPVLKPIFDASRLVRVWDLETGRSGGNVYTGVRGIGARMILATNVPDSNRLPTELPLLQSAGFTLFQTDHDPLRPEQISRDVWEFSRADMEANAILGNGLGWTYTPHYAFLPDWYRQQEKPVPLTCLEHSQPIAAFSPWDPKYAAYLEQSYRQLAALYGGQTKGRRDEKAGKRSSPRPTPDALRQPVTSLVLGIHGDYGETGFLTGARVSLPTQREEWQARFGDTHDHLGWWCGDRLARADFQEQMFRKYGGLDALNTQWKTAYRRREEIAFPRNPDSVSRRHWLDFVGWYRDSAAHMTDLVCQTARRYFPTTLLTVRMGFNNENPRSGQDSSLIPEIARSRGIEIRSTHAAYKPFAQNQAGMLGRIANAARFYGVPFWSEPPGRLSPEQTTDLIFSAVSLGSKGVFDWNSNVRENRDLYYRYGKYLRVEKPIVDVAMLYPTSYQLLKADDGVLTAFEKGCTDIRDVLNYEIVDERMVQEGALKPYRVLVLWEGSIQETATLAKIKEWVQAGGVVAAYDFGKIETVEGDRSWFGELFGYVGSLKTAQTLYRYVTEANTALPERYRLSVGQSDASSFLAGDWYEPETGGTNDGILRRWTGANAVVVLPVTPQREMSLILRASYPVEAAGRTFEVLVNGQRVGLLDQPAETTYRFPVPATLLTSDTAQVTIRCQTWRPADVVKESADRRALGVWVTYVQRDAAGLSASPVDPGTPPGHIEAGVDLNRLRNEWAKRFGRGWTVYFPAKRTGLRGYYEVVRRLTYHLSELDRSKRDALAVDDAWDGCYATLFTDKVLYYNPTSRPLTRTVNLPPAVIEQARKDKIPLTVPMSPTYNLTVEPNGIAALPFQTPPQELLLQCEKFTALGTLKASTGTAYSPGTPPEQGTTHVLIPAGGQIATRFQCDVPGRYQVYYRATRRGVPAAADLLFDEKPLAARSPRSDTHRTDETLLAGTIELSKGVHSLTLRPRPGEDLRADYVILCSDPTIAGYGFGVRP